MKKVLLLAIAVSLVVAGMAVASVVSSRHDMRLKISGNTQNQVCVFCHHPHRGYSAAGVSATLLWNFQDTDTVAFTTYGSPTVQGTVVGDALNLTGNSVYSAYCLVCHDSDFATDTLINKPSGTGALTEIDSYVNDVDNIAGDTDNLTNDHPIDFDYSASANLDATKGIKAQLNDSAVLGQQTGQTYPLFTGTMQCATCHNVHNGDNQAIQFMRGSTALSNSNICRDCHTNK